MKPKNKFFFFCFFFLNCQIDVEAPAYVRTARYAPGKYYHESDQWNIRHSRFIEF